MLFKLPSILTDLAFKFTVPPNTELLIPVPSAAVIFKLLVAFKDTLPAAVEFTKAAEILEELIPIFSAEALITPALVTPLLKLIWLSDKSDRLLLIFNVPALFTAKSLPVAVTSITLACIDMLPVLLTVLDVPCKFMLSPACKLTVLELEIADLPDVIDIISLAIKVNLPLFVMPA